MHSDIHYSRALVLLLNVKQLFELVRGVDWALWRVVHTNRNGDVLLHTWVAGLRGTCPLAFGNVADRALCGARGTVRAGRAGSGLVSHDEHTDGDEDNDTGLRRG